MINSKDKEWWKFERELMAKEHLSLEQKYNILEALYAEALYLGIFPLKDPLEGLDVDIKIAKAVGSVQRAA